MRQSINYYATERKEIIASHCYHMTIIELEIRRGLPKQRSIESAPEGLAKTSSGHSGIDLRRL